MHLDVEADADVAVRVVVEENSSSSSVAARSAQSGALVSYVCPIVGQIYRQVVICLVVCSYLENI
jgi:hypothetical protein